MCNLIAVRLIITVSNDMGELSKLTFYVAHVCFFLFQFDFGNFAFYLQDEDPVSGFFTVDATGQVRLRQNIALDTETEYRVNVLCYLNFYLKYSDKRRQSFCVTMFSHLSTSTILSNLLSLFYCPVLIHT